MATYLTKYLADWLNHEAENSKNLIINENLIKEALEAFESTEEVIIKIVPCGDYELDKRLGKP